MNYIVLSIFWIVYCFLHSFLADERVKSVVIHQTTLSTSAYRVVYNIFAIVTLVPIIYVQVNIQRYYLFGESSFLKFFSYFLISGGLFIMINCILNYFKQLSGLKKMQPVLVTTGLHSFVRHPLYLGTFIFLAGILFAFPYLSNLISFLIIVSYTLLGIRLEEKKLVKEFGSSYLNYQQTVPMILPDLF
ncbi:MAG: isoprenylcysteine carboxylmethyltransferase family protein [Ferruginibacter sp.]